MGWSGVSLLGVGLIGSLGSRVGVVRVGVGNLEKAGSVGNCINTSLSTSSQVSHTDALHCNTSVSTAMRLLYNNNLYRSLINYNYTSHDITPLAHVQCRLVCQIKTR